MEKEVVEMWRIHDVLFENYKDAEKAEDGKEVPRKVYVGVDDSTRYDQQSLEFYGDWVFADREHAQREVDLFNETECDEHER